MCFESFLRKPECADSGVRPSDGREVEAMLLSRKTHRVLELTHSRRVVLSLSRPDGKVKLHDGVTKISKVREVLLMNYSIVTSC
jgi:hypothetical protein